MIRVLILLLLMGGVAEAQTKRLVYEGGTAGAGDLTYTNSQLQDALNDALPGEEILLQENVTYVGEFVLRQKSCGADNETCFITLRSGVTSAGVEIESTMYPPTDVRITPAYSSLMAKLETNVNNRPALRTVQPSETGNGCAGAPCKGNWWRIKRIEFQPRMPWAAGAMLMLGSNDGSLDVVSGDIQDQTSEIPKELVVEQCYFRGDTVKGQHRGLTIAARDVVVKDSYFKDIKSTLETQAIHVTNTDGPVELVNNYIEGSTENVMAGGADPYVLNSATLSASPAPTAGGGRLSNTTNLKVGQWVSVERLGTEYSVMITSLNAGSGDVTWSPTLAGAPDQPGDVDWSLNIGGLWVTKNHMTKPVEWRSPLVPTPASVTAQGFTTGGSLAAGTYWYRVSANLTVNAGQPAISTSSAQVSGVVTSGSTGRVVVSWGAVPNAESYNVYGRTSGGQNIRWTVTSPTVSYTDDGTGGAAETPIELGTRWFVKNVFELKACDGLQAACLIEGNIFEYSWEHGQTGSILLIKNTNQDGNDDSVVTRNLVIQRNWLRHGVTGLEICTTDCENKPSGRIDDLTVRDNLLEDLGPQWGQSLRSIHVTAGGYGGFTLNRAGERMKFEHNTIFHRSDGHSFLFLDTQYDGVQIHPFKDFIFRNNIVRKLTFGLRATNDGGMQAEGTTSWNIGTTGSSVFTKNVIADATCSNYPDSANNFCPIENDFQAEFENYASGDYQIKQSSPWSNAGTDGKDLGVDFTVWQPMINIALNGDNRSFRPISFRWKK